MSTNALKDPTAAYVPRDIDPLLIDLSGLPLQVLRGLCDEAHRQLDQDFPPFGAPHRCAALLEELEAREAVAEKLVASAEDDPAGTQTSGTTPTA